MKKLITLAGLLAIASSCTVARGVKVSAITDTSIVTAKGDTIPTRERLRYMVDIGDSYNFWKINGRYFDAVPLKKRK